MNTQAGGFFARFLARKPDESSNNPEIDEVMVGKTLSLELFKEDFAHLGYDFEVFVDTSGKIYRFRRIPSDTAPKDGDVW